MYVRMQWVQLHSRFGAEVSQGAAEAEMMMSGWNDRTPPLHSSLSVSLSSPRLKDSAHGCFSHTYTQCKVPAIVQLTVWATRDCVWYRIEVLHAEMTHWVRVCNISTPFWLIRYFQPWRIICWHAMIIIIIKQKVLLNISPHVWPPVELKLLFLNITVLFHVVYSSWPL